LHLSGAMRYVVFAFALCALVAVESLRRRHAFDGGILRVAFWGLVQRPYVQPLSPGRQKG